MENYFDFSKLVLINGRFPRIISTFPPPIIAFTQDISKNSSWKWTPEVLVKVCHSCPTSLEPTSLMVFGEQAKDQESRKLTKNYQLFIHQESETLRTTFEWMKNICMKNSKNIIVLEGGIASSLLSWYLQCYRLVLPPSSSSPP